MRTLPGSAGGQPPKIVTVGILSAILTVWTVGVTALFASGLTPINEAVFLAVAPWAGLAAALRPEWLLLALIAMPASFTAIIPLGRILPLITLALIAIVVTRQTLSFGLGTGITALMAIAIAGYVFQADVGSDASAINRTMIMLFVYYTLLALLAFNVAILGNVTGEQLGAAYLAGVVTTLIAGLVGYQNPWFAGGTQIVSRTYLGYLAAGGFGVAVARLLDTDRPTRRGAVFGLLTATMFSLVILSLGRAVWVAALATFVLLMILSKRRSYALLVIPLVALALWIPVARQEIASLESGDIAVAVRTGEFATGRLELWSAWWARGEEALPWGNGFGFTWSISSEDLFGAPGGFGPPGTSVVYPHNDFVFLFVEFGIPGLLLLSTFWLLLLRAHIRVARSARLELRRAGRTLLGIVLTGLIVASVDNLFGIRPIAERFFIAAGVVFALWRIEAARTPIRAPLYQDGMRLAAGNVSQSPSLGDPSDQRRLM